MLLLIAVLLSFHFRGNTAPAAAAPATTTPEPVTSASTVSSMPLGAGAFLINTVNSQLMDDCAVKQLLIDGTLVGCAIDRAERPQWMEAWFSSNDLYTPRELDQLREEWCMYGFGYIRRLFHYEDSDGYSSDWRGILYFVIRNLCYISCV